MEEIIETLSLSRKNSLSQSNSEISSTVSSRNITINFQDLESQQEEEIPLIKSISFILLKLIKENSEKPDHKHQLKYQKNSSFNSKALPKISIYDYLVRLTRYCKIEVPSIITMLIYIDRICRRGNIILTNNNVHRLILISIVISIKFNEDQHYSNHYYSKVGGIDLKSLNKMEHEFLTLISFYLLIDKNTYKKYENFLLGIE